PAQQRPRRGRVRAGLVQGPLRRPRPAHAEALRGSAAGARVAVAVIGQERQTILFGQSYFLRFDPKLFAAMQPYPPLGTLYAASYMRSRGYDVDLFDAMLADSENEWDQALARNRPTVAVLYEDNFNYLSKMCLLRMREAALTMVKMAHECG